MLGATLVTWVTFVPSFLWIFLGAPYIERLRGHAALSGALAAITAAVVGVILNLAVWFALHAVFGRVVRWSGLGLSLEVPDPASLERRGAGADGRRRCWRSSGSGSGWGGCWRSGRRSGSAGGRSGGWGEAAMAMTGA